MDRKGFFERFDRQTFSVYAVKQKERKSLHSPCGPILIKNKIALP